MKEYRRRLLIRSFWFQAQLAKLDRLAEACLAFDQFVRPEFTCAACLAFLMQVWLRLICAPIKTGIRILVLWNDSS